MAKATKLPERSSTPATKRRGQVLAQALGVKVGPLYCEEIQDAAEAAGIPEDDAFQLRGIELACEIADAYIQLAVAFGSLAEGAARRHLQDCLSRIVLATNGSALRKGGR